MMDGFSLGLEETVNELGDSDGVNVGFALAVGLTEGSRDGAALIELISLELGLDDGTSDNLGDSDGTVVIILMLILMNKSSVAQSKSSSTEGASEGLWLGNNDGGSDDLNVDSADGFDEGARDGAALIEGLWLGVEDG